MKWQLGKVTSTSPLRVALADGGTPDVDPLPLVAGLRVDEMVWCQVEGLTLVVLGRVRGGPVPAVVTDAITASVNWSIDSQAVAKSPGGLVQVNLTFTRTGGAVTVPADGNIANSTIGTLAGPYRPLMVSGLGPGQSGVVAQCFAWTDGTIQMGAVAPGLTIPTGSGWSASGSFMAATI